MRATMGCKVKSRIFKFPVDWIAPLTSLFRLMIDCCPICCQALCGTTFSFLSITVASMIWFYAVSCTTFCDLLVAN